MIKLPGLIDPHVHLREPGATHKEDYDSGTSAALAGGITTVLAMPNTKPPIFDAETLDLALSAAKQKARCDYGQFLGAGPDNASWDKELPQHAAGLKMYLDSTFGELRLDDMTLWMPHFQNYPKNMPIVAHSESRSMAAAILFAAIYDYFAERGSPADQSRKGTRNQSDLRGLPASFVFIERGSSPALALLQSWGRVGWGKKRSPPAAGNARGCG